MIDIHTLAHYLGVPVSTVHDWRTKRQGPVGYRFGKYVMFALFDVKVWIEQQRDPARAGSALHGGGARVSRSRQPIGSFGDVSYRVLASGHILARARYRDWDGQTRQVQASGPSRKAAELVSKQKRSERSVYQPGTAELTANSIFKQLADYWLADMDMNPDLAEGTRQLYRWNMEHLVLPHFANLTLREIGVACCDLFIEQQRQTSYNRAKQSRNVLRQAFSLAVRHEILPRSPMENIARITRPRTDPTALTPAE